jgi:hypothetical protein
MTCIGMKKNDEFVLSEEGLEVERVSVVVLRE